MTRFSIVVLYALTGVISLLLAACMHAPANTSSSPAPPTLDGPARPINLHGGTEEYGEREVSFDFNQATLNPQAASKLDETADALKKYPELTIEVSGYADSRENHSQQLSVSRARTAYDYLLSKGVEASQMVGPVGYGASRPMYFGKNPEDPANRANRRVEVNVQN